jgi:hypothetical protein
VRRGLCREFLVVLDRIGGDIVARSAIEGTPAKVCNASDHDHDHGGDHTDRYLLFHTI